MLFSWFSVQKGKYVPLMAEQQDISNLDSLKKELPGEPNITLVECA
jgi:hypothetical protein